VRDRRVMLVMLDTVFLLGFSVGINLRVAGPSTQRP
jgi:hypothetical protein